MPRRPDPYGSFKFKLELGNIQVAGFAECTGLQIETKMLEYKEGGRNTHALKFPETSEVSNITLKKGISLSNDLYDWLMTVVKGTFNHKNSRPANSNEDISNKLSILLMDNSGREVVRKWVLRRAFPVKWTGPELKANASEISIETLEIANEGIELS
ncbi:MAG: phage tail protein [Deltaproteobacteria bacterium]|nr:phage tail protein [Deltaproteobacteria bacterium]